jgi:glycosyltransferase involved in cell wall biosynthesis
MSGHKPEFSVVVPVHNGEPYISSCIESILAQSYQHFNIVVLENCSQDRTVSIIESYRDPRISLVPTDRLLSIEENWSRILGLNLSEYLTILGHDDLLYPDFLQEIVHLINVEPHASLYRTHFDLIDAQGAFLRRCKPMPYRETGESFLQSRQRFQQDMFGTGFAMRFADYKKVGGLPAMPGLYFSDELAFYKLAALSEKVCSPKTQFAYRYHRISTSNTISLDMVYDACMCYLRTLLQTDYFRLNENALLARKYVEKTFNRRYYRFLVDLILSSNTDKIQAYRDVKSRLFVRATSDRLFNIYDPTSAIIEAVLNLPFEQMRRLIARFIEFAAVVTRRMGK